MKAGSIAQGAWGQMVLAIVMMVSGAFGQTAADLGEGLRVELTATTGVMAVKWWGKAGRTYFVQSSETLLPDSWQYMPVVEAGADAVSTWNLQTSASKMFVRLVYTDAAFTGGAGAADFDGDGLSNAAELAMTGPRTNPFFADTDADGFSDSVEWGGGFNPTSGTSNPEASLPNGGVWLEYAVVDTWDHVQWRKQTSPSPVKYSTVADYGPGGDYDVSSWQETVPTVPSPRGLGPPESLNFSSWSTQPTTGEDTFFDQTLYAYRVEADMAVVPGPEAPYLGGRNSGARYAKLRLVTNYPRMQAVTRLVKVLPKKWNAQYGAGFWQGSYAGEEAPQYYALQIPPATTIGPPVTAQLEVETGIARTATVALDPTIQITRDIPGDSSGYEPILGRTAQALVGQQINVRLAVPAGATSNDFHWSISGPKIKDYPEPTENSAHVVPLEAADFTAQSMTFYWVLPGNHTVSANCLVDGVRVHISQQFEVSAPACTLTGTQEAIRTGPGYSFGGGAAWSATVGVLPPAFPKGGRWMFVQTVRVNQLQVPDEGPPNKVNEFNGEWCLDTLAGVGVAYKATGKKNVGESNATDDPAFGNAYDMGSEQLDEAWNTYVMFKSNEDEARWVPLKVMPWERGYKSDHAFLTGIYFFEAYPQQPQNLSGVETRYHPEWNHITSFLVIPQP